MLQKGIDIKKGCDLPEVRANINSSKVPRSHFCALTVQQGCICLQCQLRDRMFLVCISESKFCYLLASALHWDRSTRTTGICPRPRQHLAIFPSYCLFSFSCFPSVAQLGPSFLQKHLHVSVESHTGCIFQAFCILLHSLQASPGSDSTWKGMDSAQDCRPVCQPVNCWMQWVPPLLGQELVKHTRRSWIHLVCGEAVLKSLSKCMQQEWVTCFCSCKASAGSTARRAQQIQWPSIC